MKPILIVYATREGHTRTVAEHIAKIVGDHGMGAYVVDAAQPPEAIDLSSFGAAVLAASVHAGKHEREMVKFVRTHRATLEQLPSVFLSVSLTEAGAEDEQQSPEHRAQARATVERMIDDFFEQTGWRASTTHAVAGALLYTQYGWFMRQVMKQIVKHQGGSTDTSRDHDYTDWVELDQFITDLLASSFQPASNAAAHPGAPS